MAAPVIIDFQVTGIQNVNRALKSTENAVAAAERATQRAAEQSAAKQKQNADKLAAYMNRVRDRSATMAGRYASQEVDRREREAARAKRIADREADQAAKRAERKADKDGREARRAADEVIKQAERAARAEKSEAEKAAKWRANIRETSMRMESRYLDKKIRDEGRVRRDQDFEAMKDRRRFVGAIGGAIANGAATGVGKVADKARETAGMVAQLGGGFSIADSVQRGVALKGKLADIASRDTDQGQGRKRRSTSELEGAVRGVGSEFGIDADTATEGLDKFASKTGELGKGMEMLRGLAELSRAGAGSLDDLADAAGDIFNADKTQSAEQVLSKLRQFAIQGQKGAVEMKDLASQMAKLGAAAGQFEGGSDRNLLTMGALAQLARAEGGASGPAQAVTGVASMANQFSKNARIKGMEALGVEAKTESGTNRPIDEVLMDILRGAEKKARATGHGLRDFDVMAGGAIADTQAKKALTPLANAFKAAGGGDAGIAAAKAKLAEFGADPNRDLKKEFHEKANARMEEADVQMAKVAAEFDQAVSTKVIPALIKLVPVFEKMVPILVDMSAKAIPAFVDLLKTIADFAEKNKGIIADIAAHPIAALIGAEISKSFAAAALGEFTKRLLQQLMGSQVPGITVPGSNGPGGSNLPGVGPGGNFGAQGPRVALAGTMGIAGGMAVAGVITGAGRGAADGADTAENYAAKVTALASGRRDVGMSPEAALRLRDEAQSRLDSKGGVLRQTGNIITGVLGGDEDASKEYKQYKADQEIVKNENLKKAIEELAIALKNNTGAVRQSSSGTTGGAGAVPGAPRNTGMAQR